jgi:hypothetical protein
VLAHPRTIATVLAVAGRPAPGADTSVSTST